MAVMRYFVLIGVVALWGCSTKDDSATPLEEDTNDEKVYWALSLDEMRKLYSIQTYLSDEGQEAAEIIDFDCAILIYPTNAQMYEMKRDFEEEDFHVVADGNNRYHENAIGMIDSLGVRTMTVTERYLRLKGKENWNLDIRKPQLPSWNLIFFKTTKEPKVISIVNLTVDEVREYFEIGQ
jgi:hypothetical protein